MKIYTKTGDEGMTSLYGGKRVSKSGLQIESYGTLDELNVVVGGIRAHADVNCNDILLHKVQENLFNIGSYLASDFGKEQLFKPQLNEVDIIELENEMDKMDEVLPPMKYFILPGGNHHISQIHLARVVSRRAERLIVSFYNSLEMDLGEKSFILKYLNRLSDYFFVLSRYVANKNQIQEYYWKPKK